MAEGTTREGSKLYYSISEVAELVKVKPHVLRYWETQFKMLKPRKNRAGNRTYRAKDLQMALRIKRLLYDEGFTIAGARRKLLEERRGGARQAQLELSGLSQEEFVDVLKQDLEALLRMVKPPAGGGSRRHQGPAAGLLGEVGTLADE